MKNLLKILVAVCLVFVVAQANAQMKFGAKAGLNLANMATEGDTKSQIGFHVGGVAEFELAESIVLQPGVLFSTKGAKADEGDYRVKLNYIEVPINAMYKLDMEPMKILVLAGPYLGYAISGNAGTDDENADIEFGSEDTQTKALDFGLNIGAGVEISNFQVTAQYGLGLANIANGDGDVKNRVIGISVAYLFGGK